MDSPAPMGTEDPELLALRRLAAASSVASRNALVTVIDLPQSPVSIVRLPTKRIDKKRQRPACGSSEGRLTANLALTH